MKFTIHPVTPYQQNCSLVWCEHTRKAVLIDPGGDTQRLREAIEHEGVTPEGILLTHGHIDHVGGAAQLARELQVPIIGPHRADAFWLDQLPTQAQMFGFPPTPGFEPERWLQDGDQLQVGEVVLDVIHCPGHTPGHVVFVDRLARVAFVGDVLFEGSIGRTDFPQGDHAALLHSIRDKLFPLGDDIRFVPGHGPMGTFGKERRDNPFVGERTGRWQ
ncbi:MAG: MBL fold metallo-hydrolase [Pseudomonadota bacterium]